MKCDVCGQDRSEEEVIQFEGRWICAGCKPVFFQRMMEGRQPDEARSVPAGFDEQMLAPLALVSLSWKFLCRDWPAMVAVTLLGHVPVSIAFAVNRSHPEMIATHPFLMMGIESSMQGLIAVIGTLGIAKIVSERLEGRSVETGEAVGHALRRWGPAAGTNLFAGCIVFLLLLLLVVPGIIWVGYYTFATIVVSLRGCAGMDALNYSRSLVLGRWWAVFGRTLLLSLVVGVPMIPIQVGMRFLGPWPAVMFLASLLLALCGIFSRVGTVVLFLNLDAMRRRLEGSSAAALES